MNARLFKTLVPSVVGTLLLLQPLASMPMAGAPAQPTGGMPSATQQAPPSNPQPMSKPVAAQPQQPAAAQPTATTATALKELQEALQGMEQAKSALTKLLTELDAKLLDARKLAAEAKSLSFGLLEKQQESDAKADYAKIRDANKSVQDAQQFAQTEFTKGFNDKIADLRVKSTQADAALKAINAQKAATAQAKASQPQQMPAAGAATPSNPQTSVESTQQTSGVIDSMSSGIASFVGGVKGLFGDTSATKKKTVNLSPIPADAEQRAQEATAMVQQMDKNLQSLDSTRVTIQQYLATINQSSKYIETLAKQSPEGENLLKQSKKSAASVEEPGWKKTTLHYAGKLLDGIGYMATSIYQLFDATIGTFTRKLIKDVKKKIATQESAATTAAT